MLEMHSTVDVIAVHVRHHGGVDIAEIKPRRGERPRQLILRADLEARERHVVDVGRLAGVDEQQPAVMFDRPAVDRGRRMPLPGQKQVRLTSPPGRGKQERVLQRHGPGGQRVDLHRPPRTLMRDVLTVQPEMDLLRFQTSAGIPNNPTLPVVVHHDVGEIVDDPAACERLFGSHDWGGTWRNGIFPFHHFHSNAHEALGIVSGAARVTLGGPGGETLEVRAGDVLVLPAGTGHKREDAGSGLLVIGAYPPGQESYDLLRGDPDELDRARRNIAAVALPGADPVLGADGGLRSEETWR